MSEQSNQLRLIKMQISEIPSELWKMEMKQNLNEMCDSLIDIFDNYDRMDSKTFRHKFEKVLDTFLAILRIKKTELKAFQDFIEPRIDKAKRLRKDGNNEQILWTGLNCVVNGVGLAALFVPGLNIPILSFAIAGSILGVWGRIKSENEINEKFSNIMKEIEKNESYTLISFSSLVKNKQQEFEIRRDELISRLGYKMNEANTVVMLEMILECLSNFQLPNGSTPGIAYEVTANIFSTIKNSISVFFNNYGKHAFNLMDDAFSATSKSLTGIATGLVVITFAINIYQLYKGVNDREERVEKIEKMYKMLGDGKDSLQFFIDELHQMQLLFSRESTNQLEEKLEGMGSRLELHENLFRCLFRSLPLNNEFTRELEGASSLPCITFTEIQNDNDNNVD